ncbi:F-box only protein 16-like [Anneissia japonica]|uniref:F-box only protein 16-like n=1 Tax=Anneissia japonica TaxID=1529436 RepID=UPI0014255325|nr:F-box only protein 16-like [Anneissia japonica]
MAWSGDQKRLDNKKRNLDSKARFSTWTPMNHQPTNDKVFEERLDILHKWFDKWTDLQKKKALEHVLGQSNLNQLEFVKGLVSLQVPVRKEDFTRVLPRVICIYIFSYLDPRSLCRCAQVCWYWKFLCESDQIWMPKALKLNWYLTFQPSPFETGVWKRLYLENVRSLHYLPPKNAPSSQPVNGEQKQTKSSVSSARKPPRPRSAAASSKPLEHKPWRGTDPKAVDTVRNNYLDNNDEILKARERRMEKRGTKLKKSGSITDMSESAKQSRPMSAGMAYKLKKASSTSNVSDVDGRPDWARGLEDTSNQYSTSLGMSVSRPGPVVKPVPSSKAVTRTERHPPANNLFPTQAWTTVNQDSSDDER